MMKDYIQMAFTNLKHRKLRTFLTLIGIFVGIAAVVSLVSLAQGFQNYLEDEFQELGADKILINPKGSSFGVSDNLANPLTVDDVEVIRKSRGVDEATYYNFKVAEVTWGKDDILFPIVMSYPLDDYALFKETTNTKVIDGRPLKEGDRFKAVVGYNYIFSNNYDKKLVIGKDVEINGIEFEIIGVNNKIGTEQDDTSIMITEEAYFEVFDDAKKDNVASIVARVNKGQSPSDVVEDIEKDLRKFRGSKEGEEDFEVTTFEELIQSFLTIFSIVSVVLIGIAAISLVVGGIGIMNTMYTAVLERTKEIGIMKAIGAKNSDILQIFVIESGFLGLIGGAIGVGIGIGLAKIVEFLGANAFGTEMLKAAIPWWLVVGALMFAFVLGAVFGTLPARRASKMNPVDALRTE